MRPNVFNPKGTPRRMLDITTDAKLRSTLLNHGSTSEHLSASGVLYVLIFDYKVCTPSQGVCGGVMSRQRMYHADNLFPE